MGSSRIYPNHSLVTLSQSVPTWDTKKGGVHTERPPWGVLEMAGYADFITEKVKGLFSHENKPFCVPFGGDKRDRTADLLNAIQALSQLSYTPIYFQKRNFIGYAIFDCRIVVTQWGHTFNLLGSQLSYTPMLPETLDFAGFLSYSIF